MKTRVGRLDRPVDPARDHVWGAHDAAMQLVEFGDYECPHCRRAHHAVKATKEQFGEQFSYTFRHLPSPKLHPHAELAAEAAEAAAAQGKFWEMHDALFDSEGNVGLSELIRMASELGLDVNRFTADLDAHTFAARVHEDVESAIQSDSHGTPTFYVNGYRYDGAWDTAALTEAIQPRWGFKMKRLSQDFAGLPASGGMVLLLFTVLALIWANSPWAHGYA
ncbi:MAG: thioredoxin domain-containing protein, partial [Burkholderiales bacterium]